MFQSVFTLLSCLRTPYIPW